MPKHSDPLADAIGDILATGVLAAGLVAVLAGMAIAELLHTPTEEKLRRLTPQETWGALISDKPCLYCRARRESGAFQCHNCGRILT